MNRAIDAACAVGSRPAGHRGAGHPRCLEEAENRVISLSHDALTATRTSMTLCASTFPKAVGPPTLAHRSSGRRTGDAAAGRRGPDGRHRATPLDAYPLARNVLEAHADAVCARLDGSDPAAMVAPISDDFVLALRAEANATVRWRCRRPCRW